MAYKTLILHKESVKRQYSVGCLPVYLSMAKEPCKSVHREDVRLWKVWTKTFKQNRIYPGSGIAN